MNLLFDQTFESERLPDAWFERHGEAAFDIGALRVTEALRFMFDVPEPGWQRLRMELHIQPVAPWRVTFGDDSRSMTIDFRGGFHAIETYRHVATATSKHPMPQDGQSRVLTFEWDRGRARAWLDDDLLIDGADPAPGAAIGPWQVMFVGNWRIHRVRCLGGEPDDAVAPIPALRADADFQLHVAIDFNSDVQRAPWTEAMFDRMFEQFRGWGVSRCDWLWHGDGMQWANVRHRNAKTTIERLGNLFPLVVEKAHAHGIALYGLFKPFEVGEFERFADSDRAAAEACRMARKPGAFGDPPPSPVTRIDLVKEDEAQPAFAPGEIGIFTSDDNRCYTPYAGPVKCMQTVEDYPVWEHTPSGGRPTGASRRACVLRLTDLNITSRYVLLTTPRQEESFANNLVNMIHVFDESGEQRMITLGISSQLQRSGTFTLREWSGDNAERTIDFGKTAITRNPSANFPGFNGLTARHVLDAREGIIAFARGKPQAEDVLSPSFAGTRDWWLSQLQTMLDAGADGIELRVRNHQTPLTWAELGFEQPIRDAMLAEHGVDIHTTDDFDRVAWRIARGAAYTDFCRRAKTLVKRYGKRLGLHIGPIQALDPRIGATMDIHFDWRTWIDEGLADSVTLKEAWPGTRLVREVLARTRPRNIPVIFSPFAIGVLAEPGGVDVCAQRARRARCFGMDGFQFYESAAIVEATAAGDVVPRVDRLDQFAQAVVNL